MSESNPFKSPTSTTQTTKGSPKNASLAIYATIGGGIGLAVGVLGIVVLFLNFPGPPGIAELLILLVGTVIVFVIPGIVIGMSIGFAVNSAASKKS